MENGYKGTNFDHCVFMKKILWWWFSILLLYIDDMLTVGHYIAKINDLKVKLGQTSMMKELEYVKMILGIRIAQDKKSRKLWLLQETYVGKCWIDSTWIEWSWWWVCLQNNLSWLKSKAQRVKRIKWRWVRFPMPLPWRVFYMLWCALGPILLMQLVWPASFFKS